MNGAVRHQSTGSGIASPCDQSPPSPACYGLRSECIARIPVSDECPDTRSEGRSAHTAVERTAAGHSPQSHSVSGFPGRRPLPMARLRIGSRRPGPETAKVMLKPSTGRMKRGWVLTPTCRDSRPEIPWEHSSAFPWRRWSTGTRTQTKRGIRNQIARFPATVPADRSVAHRPATHQWPRCVGMVTT